MNLISERGVNLHFYPIIEARGRKIEEDYVREKNSQNTFIAQKGSRWDLNCYKLMDYLASVYRDLFVQRSFSFFNKIITTKDVAINQFTLITTPNRIYEIENPENNNPSNLDSLAHIYRINLTVSIDSLLKHICFKGMNSRELKNLIERASNCYIKTRYEFKSESKQQYSNGDVKYDFKSSYDNLPQERPFQRLFDYEIIKGTDGKDGKKYGYKYVFKFSSPLAYSFIHNIATGGYAVLDDRLYMLSKYAQLLYRKRFLNYDRQLTLNLTNTFYDLGLTNNNKTQRRKKFVNLIEEIESLNLIKIVQHKTKEDIFVLQRENDIDYKKVIRLHK